MLNEKIYKPIQSQAQRDQYSALAKWCNENNAHLEDKGDYYEVIANPVPSIEELKERKLAQVDSWTANKITGGFISSASGEPVRYDSDKDTQITMQGIALNVNTELFAEKYPNGCPVRGYIKGENTKSVLMLSAEQVLQWCADLSIHIGNCKQEGWIKQAEVNASSTKEELDTIILE